MKKLIALLLALVMVGAMFTACGGDKETEKDTDKGGQTVNTDKTPIADNMETTVNAIIEKNPVEFMGGLMPVDLTDTSEDGLWAIKSFTGLDSAEGLKDIAVYEPMMGSIAFSLVLVRVDDAANAKDIAQKMSDNIDTRKWICVEADDKLVAGYSDVVMLIMVGSDSGLTAQSYVDTFEEVAGGEVDFTIQ